MINRVHESERASHGEVDKGYERDSEKNISVATPWSKRVTELLLNQPLNPIVRLEFTVVKERG